MRTKLLALALAPAFVAAVSTFSPAFADRAAAPAQAMTPKAFRILGTTWCMGGQPAGTSCDRVITRTQETPVDQWVQKLRARMSEQAPAKGAPSATSTSSAAPTPAR